jgi:hypothetical protein
MRAKFNVVSVKNNESNGVLYSQDVTLTAVYANDTNAEDNQFSSATPWGTLTMDISNPNAFDFLKEGESYYLDFTKAEKKY